MTLPDSLSRYHPQPGPEIALDIAIHHAHLETQQKMAFQEAIATDPKLQALAQTIIDGWPEDANEVPISLCKYFAHATTVSMEDGLILKGEALLISETKPAAVLKWLHDCHQGITKTNL